MLCALSPLGRRSKVVPDIDPGVNVVKSLPPPQGSVPICKMGSRERPSVIVTKSVKSRTSVPGFKPTSLTSQMYKLSGPQFPHNKWGL